MATIPDQDLDNLTAAIDQLLADIRLAIQNYQPQSANQVSPPNWNTPQPWLKVALPNLEAYRRDWLDAVRAHRVASNHAELVRTANHFSGLGKKMDFSTQWMRPDDRMLIEQSIERVGTAAYLIYRN